MESIRIYPSDPNPTAFAVYLPSPFAERRRASSKVFAPTQESSPRQSRNFSETGIRSRFSSNCMFNSLGSNRQGAHSLALHPIPEDVSISW
ncbi:hypothetical protein OESDEN_21251 [Oesophagostomum dentatum]|uniref:Uncharacterized protein n=1 Tax=Oesophagostomum dentatum TaxID=61180 RepID=A0A0B1S5G9_OESDE|nr:hypothetical protein OESDEN_21251 [Oesophagostomum dentatum]